MARRKVYSPEFVARIGEMLKTHTQAETARTFGLSPQAVHYIKGIYQDDKNNRPRGLPSLKRRKTFNVRPPSEPRKFSWQAGCGKLHPYAPTHAKDGTNDHL